MDKFKQALVSKRSKHVYEALMSICMHFVSVRKHESNEAVRHTGLQYALFLF